MSVGGKGGGGVCRWEVNGYKRKRRLSETVYVEDRRVNSGRRLVAGCVWEISGCGRARKDTGKMN